MLTGSDLTLLSLALGAVVTVIVLISWLKMHPFPALVIAALGLGLLAGAPTAQVLKSFRTGFGDTMANVGVVLALGAAFGGLLAASKGAQRLAEALVGWGGPRLAPWAMMAVALIIGLPVFFETGVAMMMPIIVAVGAQLSRDPRKATSGAPYLLAGLPALAGLSVVHGLVPPHPGPLIAINALNANLGVTLAIGLIVALPTAILAGPVFTGWAARHASAQPPVTRIDALAQSDASLPPPGIGVTLATILFPIILMMAKAAAQLGLPPGPLRTALEFAGEPVVALLAATLVAMVTFGSSLGRGGAAITAIVSHALLPMAAIMLVIGAGGAFKQTLVDVGLGGAIAHVASALRIPPLLLGWATAVMIRLATGSATVATITAAGLLASLAASDPHLNAALLALSIGAGSLFFSHVNDAGFWMVKEYMGMSLTDTFKTWSLLETVISVCGFGFILIVSLFV
jgi:GntP family gluconate:H+ symporter